ncbi:hypothetical protein MTsPCn9_06580 [Croceitalea sp. MTPC9]|uniref:hypothetical protein n=1 Tax=unclassified Croceitalea TaxID=2632280 RepID=UPI002B3F66F7|nr:hypothetical protein MTsPCn6_02130 [Croceitalea sp. MTPC6]GMN15722.1 hypothetical protein MTsPCn9_06580 [Croceitalea sp. MTPC9]
MTDLNFPISFDFNITTLSNDFTAKDANGKVIAYVRQKMFKLKEDIEVFSNETKTQVNYHIKADKWIDFSTAYSFTDSSDKELGKVARKGWASLWKANYDIIDQHQKPQYKIREENAWVKVADGLLGQIPILNFFTGYLFNPSYIVLDKQEQIVVRLKKEASFFGRKFQISQVKPTDADDDHRIMLSLMMLVLLERRRG